MSPGSRPSPMRDNIGHMIPTMRIASPSPIRKRCASMAVEPPPNTWERGGKASRPGAGYCARVPVSENTDVLHRFSYISEGQMFAIDNRRGTKTRMNTFPGGMPPCRPRSNRISKVKGPQRMPRPLPPSPIGPDCTKPGRAQPSQPRTPGLKPGVHSTRRGDDD
jgi:hypothetical protein